MRYTTIIDISENRELYRNHNARLLYLHLVLKSGYHDDDRDQVRLSIRSMAYDSGLSVSAVRHALKVLEKNGLLSKRQGRLYVTKFVVEKTITKRARKAKEIDPKSVENTSQMPETTPLADRARQFIEHFRKTEKAAKNGEEWARAALIRNRQQYERFLKYLEDHPGK